MFVFAFQHVNFNQKTYPLIHTYLKADIRNGIVEAAMFHFTFIK